MSGSANPLEPTEPRRPMPSTAEAGATPVLPGYGPYGPYGQTAFSDGIDFSALVWRYIHICFRYKWVILGSIIIFAAVGMVLTMLKTPLYSASTRIQIDRDANQVVDGGITTPAETGSDFLRTQYELLHSRSLAERVVSNLQLASDESLFAPRNKSLTDLAMEILRPPQDGYLPSVAARSEWATGIVSANIAIKPVQGSRLVDLVYTDPSPERAQRVVNAYADAYIAANLDKRFEANAYARTFLDDQIQQIKIRMNESEQALIDFTEREKSIDVSDKAPITEDNLAAANAALGTIVSDRMQNEQSWRQIENAEDINLPQFVSNAVIDGLRARRNALVTDYEEKLATFKPSYPAMVQISNRIAEVDRQLASEVKTIKATAKAAYDASVARERDMQNRIEQLRADVLESQKKGIRYKILKNEVDLNRTMYSNLLQRYKEVDIAGGVGTNNVFVVDRALAPKAPSEPDVSRALMVSLMLGVGSGFGLALLIDKLNDRVSLPDEVELISGLPTLGIIPTASVGASFRDELLNNPRSAIAEAYRSLATALQFSSPVGTPRSIAVTSSGPSEGKSSTAFAIARHFATTGQRVLLIDADMRKPSLHQVLGCENTTGLSHYLVGSTQPQELLHETQYPTLSFLPSGPLPPNAADLLSGTRMFSLISAAMEVYDLVVIDTPPLVGLADAQLLAGAASATVFVVASDQQRKGVIRAALRRLQLTRCEPIGTVLTNFHARSVGYGSGYGYVYGYGHGYGYGHETDEPKRNDKPRKLAAGHPQGQGADAPG